MRCVVFGVGAIGTYIGGSLALKGNEVAFFERPGAAGAIRAGGLRLVLQDGEHVIDRPIIEENYEDLFSRKFDLGILAIKSYDTINWLKEIKPYTDQLPPILSLQNGVDNEFEIGKILGINKVIRGTVTTAISRKGPGSISVERLRGMGIANEHPEAADWVCVFREAGLRARLYRHGLDMKWSKMLTNLPANATSAILNVPASQVYAHAGVFHVEVCQLREAMAVMKNLGIRVVDLPGTPVGMLALLAKLPEKISQPLMRQALGKGRGGKMPSFHIDLYSGSGRSEVDFLNGAVVRYGKEAGVKTPVNQGLTELLMKITQGETAKEEFALQPDRLIAYIQEVQSRQEKL